MATLNLFKKSDDAEIENWVKEAIKKGYDFRELRKILIKKGFSHDKILKILALHEKLKRTPGFVEKNEKKDVSVAIKPLVPAPVKSPEALKQQLKPAPLIPIKQNLEKKPEAKEEIQFTHQITKYKPKGEVIERYELVIDRAKVEIFIEKTEEGLIYSLFVPGVNIATRALLDEIRKELINITAVAIGEIIDQKSVQNIKKRFMDDAGKLLREKVPNVSQDSEEFLIGILMQEMLGLGAVEFLINDPSLEEIVIVNSKELRVYHKRHGWLLTNIKLKSEDEVVNYANIIARRVGRQINILAPLLDAHVVTGDRANAVLYPIATKGNTITIRKFARDPWTVIDLIMNKTMSKDVAALLWLAIEYEMNVLFSGGTASGKTVCLNACMPFIPPNHRVISMEDTRELMLPKFLYWCPLVTRTANPERKGEVSMLDLLVNSLRMRPDRIVLGEIRRQQEAEVLFEAMHTGHSVYSTVHADTANETIRRLINPPINIPPSMLNNVNLNVVMFRDRRKSVRRVLQLAEFLPGKESVTANLLYRWVPEKDEIIPHNKSLSFFDSLSRNTGMDEKEINENLKEKKAIFDWLIKYKVRNLESLGKLMNYYYNNREKLNNIIKNNRVKEIIEHYRSR